MIGLYTAFSFGSGTTYICTLVANGVAELQKSTRVEAVVEGGGLDRFTTVCWGGGPTC